MNNNFIKCLALGFVLLTLIAVSACGKSVPEPMSEPSPITEPEAPAIESEAPASEPEVPEPELEVPKPEQAKFEVISLDIKPLEVVAGETVSITAEVKNIGGSEGVYAAVLSIDGASIETEEVTLAAGSSVMVSFSLTEDTPGIYQVSVGGLTSSLTVEQKLIVKEVELKYDDGTVRDCISTISPLFGGHIVDFSPPSAPFTVKKIRIFGVIYAKGLESKNFDVEILDKNWKAVYSAAYPYTEFTGSRSWVEVEVPDIEVTDKFYVHVYTDSPYPGLHIGADDSVVNEHSDVTVRTEEGVTLLDEWPYGGFWAEDKSKVNWMIRVTGTGMMPPEPAEFTVSNLVITPAVAEAGQTITANAELSNIGEIEGSYSVTLKIDGVQVETKEVTVASGLSQTVSFTFTKDVVGHYNVEVGGLTGVLKLRPLTDILKQLEIAYPELFLELLKLPDLIEEIDSKNDEAIEDISYLALDPEYKTTFESILNEGIKDERKYCTPLQTLLWTAYDREFDGYNPFRNFSIVSFVSDVWETTTTSKNFTSGKWLNFIEAADRLNSPELIATYMQNNFSYSYTRGEAEGVKSAEQIFQDKKGACYDHALFAAYCLKRNGYDKAWGAKVTFDRIVQGYYAGHIGCIYQDPKDSLYYCMDFGTEGYMVYGPFSSIDEAAELVCQVGSSGEAGLESYSLHDIDLETGKYKTTW